MEALEKKPEETMVEALLNLYGDRRKEDFTEETILGSDINRIRHLFYYLKAEEKEFELQYMTDSYRARIIRVTDSTALLHIPKFEEGSFRRCRIKLDAFNELYQFEVGILSLDKEEVTIKIPAFIQSAQRRNDRRIRVDDLFMKFNIVYIPVFGTAAVDQLLETRYPEIITEIRKDEPDLYLITRILIEEIMAISPDSEIKFYGQEKRDSFMENMLSDLQKTIYIQNTIKTENYFETQSRYGLVNYQKEFMRLTRETSEEEAIKFFDSIRKEESQKFIHNYVCAPLRIFNSIIGHIFVYASSLGQTFISYEQAHYLDLLAQLLSYALSKTVIVRNYYHHALTRIRSISLAGLLFELNDEVLFDYLTYHDHIKMQIQMREKTLNFVGEIARYYPSNGGYRIGIRFLSSEPDDFRYLEEFIYRRGLTTFR